MDPQQRLLLEHGYASLHGSSQRRVPLRGGDSGVFLALERPAGSLVPPHRDADADHWNFTGPVPVRRSPDAAAGVDAAAGGSVVAAADEASRNAPPSSATSCAGVEPWT